MDVEARTDSPPPARRSKAMHRLMVALNCSMLAVGITGGQILSRLYYSKGGQRQWLSAWSQSAGWPLLLLAVAASYAARLARGGRRRARALLTPPRVLLAAAGIGLLIGADNFLYAYGLEFVPVSTSAILISTQLVFTVIFAFLIVRQRLTPPTVNAVALLTAGAVVLGLHVSNDATAGVTRAQYWMGFALTLGAAVLYGLIMPLVELAYKHAADGGGPVLAYTVVMEMQLVMGFVATAFCTVGMIANKDFQTADASPSSCASPRIGLARTDAGTARHGNGRGSAQGRGGAARARQGDAAPPGGAQLRDARAGRHGRPAPQPRLLQQGRPPAVALGVARDRRLAAAAGPRGGVLRGPARARPGRPGPAHPAAHPVGRRGPRRRHGRGRLHLRLRARVPPRVHLRHPHLHAARVHRVLRVSRRAAAPDRRVRERRGASHGGRRRAGAARLRRPPPGGQQGRVLAGVLPDARRRRALRPGAATGRARVQARRGRRARRDVRAGDRDAAGDGVLRHRVLHRRHDREQGFPGDPEGGEALRAGGGPVLHGAGVGGRAVAVLLPGRRGGHLLRAHAAGGHPHRGVHPGHGGGRRHLPAREVQQREGRGAGALALGPRVLLLRRVERGQGQEEGGRRRGGPGPVSSPLP